MSDTVRSYKPQVQVANDSKWYDNALRFATYLEAMDYALDLHMRWTQTCAYGVAESSDEPTHIYSPESGVQEIKR